MLASIIVTVITIGFLTLCSAILIALTYLSLIKIDRLKKAVSSSLDFHIMTEKIKPIEKR